MSYSIVLRPLVTIKNMKEIKCARTNCEVRPRREREQGKYYIATYRNNSHEKAPNERRSLRMDRLYGVVSSTVQLIDQLNRYTTIDFKCHPGRCIQLYFYMKYSRIQRHAVVYSVQPLAQRNQHGIICTSSIQIISSKVYTS